jgi:hypothetical protein
MDEPKQKRLKVASMEAEAIELLVATIKEQTGSKETGRVRLNPVELAIKLLQDEYEFRLSQVDLLSAVEFLSTENKASVFITLGSNIRDIWLCKNVGVELINTEIDL